MTAPVPHTRFLFTPGELRGAEAVNDCTLVSALGEVESAWLDAQLQVGLIPEDVHAEAVDGIRSTIGSYLSDGAGVSDIDLAREAERGGNPVIPFLAIVRNGLGPEASRVLHRGLTSQDVMDTAMVLLVSRTIDATTAQLTDINEVLLELSDTHAATLCLARTLTQPALPTTFGLRVANWVSALNDAAMSAPGIAEVQIGGAAGTRAAIKEFAGPLADTLIQEFNAKLLGPGTSAAASLVPWHGNRVRVLNWASYLTQCVTVCSKIARDILVGTRPEIGELALKSTGGSSAMPHKLNPTSAVLLHRNGMRAPAALSTVAAAAAEALEERSDGAWHAEWPALAELMSMSLSSLTILSDLVRGLTADPEAMRRNLDSAGPGILSERLSTVLGDRLSGSEIRAVMAPGADPVAELTRVLGPGDHDSLLRPENYLGQAEEIRKTILDRIAPKRSS